MTSCSEAGAGAGPEAESLQRRGVYQPDLLGPDFTAECRWKADGVAAHKVLPNTTCPFHGAEAFRNCLIVPNCERQALTSTAPPFLVGPVEQKNNGISRLPGRRILCQAVCPSPPFRHQSPIS